MRLFNLGKKDQHGRQRRIEHRGRHLRASRTGGVALRAQTRAAGVTLTANTNRGVRVSTTPVPRTQVAFQNGRFILRGRYHAGPLRANLSKSGVSLSARNALGSFNLTNPGRSSAKIAGFQVRGKAAAQLQLVYSLLASLVWALKASLQIVLLVLRLTLQVLLFLWNTLIAIPGAVASSIRWARHTSLRLRAWRWRRNHEAWPRTWGSEEFQAALLLAYTAWGRGHAAGTYAEKLAGAGGSGASRSRETGSVGFWQRVAEGTGALLGADVVTEGDVRVAFTALVQALMENAPEADHAELLLAADDLALEEGPRTRSQEAFLRIYADLAGLRMEPVAEPGNAPSGKPDAASPKRGLDINTASLEELRELPRIGEERAREIIAQRPFHALEELEAIQGIGPGTVERLREEGVVTTTRDA